MTFTVDAYPNTVFEGKIAEIRLNPQTVQNVVTYSVILSIQNRDLRLKPGMTASIKIMVADRDKVLKVPNAALRYHLPWNSGAFVWIDAGSDDASKSHCADPERVFLLPQAPGQRWNPEEKLRFATFDEVQNSSGKGLRARCRQEAGGEECRPGNFRRCNDGGDFR